MGLFRMSEAARAVLWLWNNDAANWCVGHHAVVHEPTGVAIWTANKVYGLEIYYNVPERDRKMAHPCGGRKLKLKWLDRKVLYRAVSGATGFAEHEIQRQISDWAADHIRNSCDRCSYARTGDPA
jgi:hypothetical protein